MIVNIEQSEDQQSSLLDEVLRRMYRKDDIGAMSIIDKNQNSWNEKERFLIWETAIHHDLAFVFYVLMSVWKQDAPRVLSSFSDSQMAFISPVYAHVSQNQQWDDVLNTCVRQWDLKNSCLVLSMMNAKSIDFSSVLNDQKLQEKFLKILVIDWLKGPGDFLSTSPFSVIRKWINAHQDCVDFLSAAWNKELKKKLSEPYIRNEERERLQQCHAFFQKEILVGKMDEDLLNGQRSSKKSKI